MDQKNFTGGLLGCAIGDAVGAPYEGLWGQSIPRNLFSDFGVFDGHPKGQYTDDTQLTVATIESIVEHGEVCPYLIAQSIFELWKTQSVIGPGGACAYAAKQFHQTQNPDTCGAEVGNAGNGTAMRTHILGLLFAHASDKLPSAVAAIAKITHRDTRSIAGGVAVAKAVQLLANNKGVLDTTLFCQEIASTMEQYHVDFAAFVREIPLYLELDDEATRQKIACAGDCHPQFTSSIITPFVIPTVLASLWAFLRHCDSWENAVDCAIRFGGDVDTLGAITGALSGVYLGVDAIPAHLVATVCDSKYLQLLARKYYVYVKSTL